MGASDRGHEADRTPRRTRAPIQMLAVSALYARSYDADRLPKPLILRTNSQLKTYHADRSNSTMPLRSLVCFGVTRNPLYATTEME